MSASKRVKPSARKQQLQRGEVGPATVAAVDRLVKSGLKKIEAFKKVAADTGRSVGTVTVTYYRLASKTKSKKPVRGRPRSVKVVGSRLGSVAKLLDDLARLLREQEQEIVQLRNENAKFEELRRLVG